MLLQVHLQLDYTLLNPGCNFILNPGCMLGNNDRCETLRGVESKFTIIPLFDVYLSVWQALILTRDTTHCGSVALWTVRGAAREEWQAAAEPLHAGRGFPFRFGYRRKDVSYEF